MVGVTTGGRVGARVGDGDGLGAAVWVGKWVVELTGCEVKVGAGVDELVAVAETSLVERIAAVASVPAAVGAVANGVPELASGGRDGDGAIPESYQQSIQKAESTEQKVKDAAQLRLQELDASEQ